VKTYVATSTPFYKTRRKSWAPKTQKERVYDAIKDAGAAGITVADLVAKFGDISKSNIVFYVNKLKKGGNIAVQGDPQSVPTNGDPKMAAFAALVGLENALTAKLNADPKLLNDASLGAAFAKYQKIKAAALAPSHASSVAQREADANAAKVALRMAVLELVKMVF
jgi:hypothetical protein